MSYVLLSFSYNIQYMISPSRNENGIKLNSYLRGLANLSTPKVFAYKIEKLQAKGLKIFLLLVLIYFTQLVNVSTPLTKITENTRC